jgi:CubicO group peptidase (beta-lactamase class C family)
VAKYLPALANMKVAVARPGAAADDLSLVPAEKPITIHDLLRHTSGFTYGLRNTHVKRYYQDLEKRRLDLTNAELVEALGQTPLAFQPGTIWEYGNSSEVIGGLIEVLSGQTLGAYFTERIYQPLGMVDTGFWLRKDQMARMAEPGLEPETGAKQVLQDHRTLRKLERGGGGLVSTVPDYLRFAQMLLNGGEFEGERLIGSKTLAWMTSDHLGTIPKGADFYAGPGYGFGLGFAVRMEQGQSAVPSSVGEYYWWGWAGTAFWVDPKEDLIGLMMIQSPALNREYPRKFRALAMQAIVD